jgi:hypothetical protein
MGHWYVRSPHQCHPTDGHPAGNGWAAMGMLRVLSTMSRSQYANSMKSEQGDIASWCDEILMGVYLNGGLVSLGPNSLR